MLYVYDNNACKIASNVFRRTENWFVWVTMVHMNVNYMDKSGYTPHGVQQYAVIFRTILSSHNYNGNQDKSI